MRTDLLTLDEAREMQKKKQKRAIKKFLRFVVAAIIIYLLFYFTSDYLTRYKKLYFLFVIIILWGIMNSKIYRFLQRKEFSGKVVYSNIIVTFYKTHLSHQPGVGTQSGDMKKLIIAVQNEDGKKVKRTVGYLKSWGEYLPGDEVVLLRFVSQPIRVKKREEKR